MPDPTPKPQPLVVGQKATPILSPTTPRPRTDAQAQAQAHARAVQRIQRLAVETARRCSDCSYWYNPSPDQVPVDPSTVGQCRRTPPNGESKWPATYAKDWCGAFVQAARVEPPVEPAPVT